MRFPASPRLAWFLSASGALLSLAVLLVGYRLDTYSFSGEIKAWYTPLIEVFPAIAALLVGGLIAARQSKNVYGWIWLLVGLGAGVLQPWGGLLATLALASSPPLIVLGGLATHLATIGWLLTLPVVPFILLLFPNGHLLSPRWRWVVWLAVAAISITILLGWAIPGESGTAPVINPFGLQNAFGQIATAISFGAVATILFVAIPSSVIYLGIRYRRVQGVERAQLRWLAFAAATFLAYYLIDATGILRPWISDESSSIISSFLLGTWPIAVGIAILRYRLYDIDVIIRKTLIYTTLTILLALVYFGGVVILQGVLAPLIGRGNTPPVIVISTLGVAALFTPLRRRVQDIIDRRFYRRKYRAEQVLADFAKAARDEPDLVALSSELERVVRETIQPERISLWIRPITGPHRQPPGRP